MKIEIQGQDAVQATEELLGIDISLRIMLLLGKHSTIGWTKAIAF